MIYLHNSLILVSLPFTLLYLQVLYNLMRINKKIQLKLIKELPVEITNMGQLIIPIILVFACDVPTYLGNIHH